MSSDDEAENERKRNRHDRKLAQPQGTKEGTVGELCLSRLRSWMLDRARAYSLDLFPQFSSSLRTLVLCLALYLLRASSRLSLNTKSDDTSTCSVIGLKAETSP